ncbi:hypothetical protein Bca4012_069325 [Brassica carinata]
MSVRGFELIDEIKAELEAQCPSNVSCTDIMALATRDSVALAGGPSYNIPTGRRDGLTTNANGVFNSLIGLTASVATFLRFISDKETNTLDADWLFWVHTLLVHYHLIDHKAFFGQIGVRRGVLQLDQRLATDEATSSVVAQYAADND